MYQGPRPDALFVVRLTSGVSSSSSSDNKKHIEMDGDLIS